MMKPWRRPELRDSIRPERVAAVKEFGFTELQARFLLHVLIYSGVFIERQYRAFTGVTHGQRTKAFLTNLVGRGYATAITPGKLHQGRLFHVPYKPLYEAIGEANNRNRRPASHGRFVERLMLLDAVMGDARHSWLGTERDKVAYFDDAFENACRFCYPQLRFGEGRDRTIRYFPDKLPIGVAHHDGRHVFLYLVTSRVPADFRAFMIRHADLLASVDNWTIRILVPRRFWNAIALHRFAIRDTYIKGLTPYDIDEFDWFCRSRRGQTTESDPFRRLDLAKAARKFSSARFRAFERVWEEGGKDALWRFPTNYLLEKFRLREGQIRFVEIPYQYLQLTPLIGASEGLRTNLVADNLATP
jgi:hypothetical protein